MNCPNMNGKETIGVMPIIAFETYSLAAAHAWNCNHYKNFGL